MTNEERKQLIGEAIGAASMCWCETPTGIFDSTRASKIVDRVTAALEAERVGDVILHEGKVDWEDISTSGENSSRYVYTFDGVPVDLGQVDGKKGSLIFREDE